MESAEVDNRKLSEIFGNIWKIYESLEDNNEPSTSDKSQKLVTNGIADCEKALSIVNKLGVFSTNENIEEVTSNEIKYLLLPGLLGYMTLKNLKKDRSEIVLKALGFYTEYLKLCNLYGVSNVSLPKSPRDDDDESPEAQRTNRAPDLREMAAKREEKIKRFKEQKEQERKLQELYEHVKLEHVDEEVKREYYITLLKKWVSCSCEEVESIQDELAILRHMKNLSPSSSSYLTKQKNIQPEKPPERLKPLIITKDDLQKKVFGAGYPSLPVYTVEEFFDQQVKEGRIPAPGAMNLQDEANKPGAEAARIEREDSEKEEKLEKDDQETLQKARDWDDWTDDHRRGWGNTQNKG